MELLGPHQTQTDFHPQRVQEPLDIPGGHPQDPPGGEMAFLCHGLGNPFFEVQGPAVCHDGDVIPLTTAGFRLGGFCARGGNVPGLQQSCWHHDLLLTT